MPGRVDGMTSKACVPKTSPYVEWDSYSRGRRAKGYPLTSRRPSRRLKEILVGAALFSAISAVRI